MIIWSRDERASRYDIAGSPYYCPSHVLLDQFKDYLYENVTWYHPSTCYAAIRDALITSYLNYLTIYAVTKNPIYT